MPAQRTRDTHPRPLDFIPDAPSTPPTLSIIAPTPRAATFPVSHTLAHDSPLSSPSSSPFEPDGRPFVSTSPCTTPSPTSVHSLLPTTSSHSTTSDSSVSPRRRKTASDVDRRPRRGDEDYVKRPENAFILFRRKCCEDRLQAQDEAAASTSDSPTSGKKPRQADLSRTISEQWRNLPAEERQFWEDKAKEKKKEHEKLYPNYVYRPQRAKDKEAAKRKGKGLRGEFSRTSEHERISFVLPLPPAARHGRSASAPTPPPKYQFITVPNVYLSPSAPTSPDLLPLISRRQPHPSFASKERRADVSSFDYIPPGQFDPSLMGQGIFGSDTESADFLNMMSIENHMSQRLTPGSLPPLNVSSESSSLLPPFQLGSPTSTNSSGAASPRFEPFTPTTASLSDSFSHLSTSPLQYNPEANISPYGSGVDFQEGLLVQQIQQEINMIEENPYWADENTLNAMWAAEDAIGMSFDSFDISAIPPVEIGLPKYCQETATMISAASFEGYDPKQQPQNPHAYLEEMSFNFDEIMAAQEY